MRVFKMGGPLWSGARLYPQYQPDGRKAPELADVLRLVPLNGTQPRSGRIFKYARANYTPTVNASLLALEG
jgi:hypothetical protein